jgi:pantoate--beta-alanine ligase
MDVVETRAAWRTRLDAARAIGRTVGLVPTMGALHDGHVSLMARARAECDVVAVSIFVNPLQFGDPADLAGYPRTLERDLAACTGAGADLVFVPTVGEMYPTWPEPPSTTVSVQGVSDAWEGASRPAHFDGVATVVAKLFAIAGACRAYFGLKDFQQLAVVRRMALDLSVPVEVVGCPIVREADGLALSSRNVRLAPDERDAATVLSGALAAGRAAVEGGERSAAVLHAVMAALVATEPLVELDYAAAVDGASLVEHETVADPARTRLLVAARVGSVRLIDNCAALAAAHREEEAALFARPGATDEVRPRQPDHRQLDHRKLERIA